MPPIIAGGNRRDKHRTTSAGSAHWASPQDACRSSLPDFARPLIEVNSFEKKVASHGRLQPVNA
jgi:hypothetical protein